MSLNLMGWGVRCWEDVEMVKEANTEYIVGYGVKEVWRDWLFLVGIIEWALNTYPNYGVELWHRNLLGPVDGLHHLLLMFRL